MSAQAECAKLSVPVGVVKWLTNLFVHEHFYIETQANIATPNAMSGRKCVARQISLEDWDHAISLNGVPVPSNSSLPATRPVTEHALDRGDAESGLGLVPHSNHAARPQPIHQQSIPGFLRIQESVSEKYRLFVDSRDPEFYTKKRELTQSLP